MLGLTLLIPSIKYLIYLDEICAYGLLFVAIADCLVNKNWKKYRLLWLLMAIMTFYAWYSIQFMDNNTTGMILKDWIIELKPYIPFAVLLSIGSQFNEIDKRYIKWVCLVNAIIVMGLILGGYNIIHPVISHPMYAGHILFICSIFYYYCSRDKSTGTVRKKDLFISFLILSIGIFTFKAKFFALYIPAIYLFFFYKPGTFRHFKPYHAIVLMIMAVGILATTWNKIQYYFLTGNSDSFDPTTVQTFARPVLYMTSGLILVDYFPFGTGLASFASFPSAENYSNVYFEYGIDNVHGISWRSEESFICDAFYPSLAQFGIMGIILFIGFWFYIYRYLRLMTRADDTSYRVPFVTGSLIIIFILAESTASTTLTQTAGMISMSLLGIVCASGKSLKDRTNQTGNEKDITVRKI